MKDESIGTDVLQTPTIEKEVYERIVVGRIRDRERDKE